MKIQKHTIHSDILNNIHLIIQKHIICTKKSTFNKVHKHNEKHKNSQTHTQKYIDKSNTHIFTNKKV